MNSTRPNKNTIFSTIRLFIMLDLLLSCISCESYVTFTVENGSGPPLSKDSAVTISLDNQYIGIRGVQMDICDVDDYLTCTGCETTNRTLGFICETNERMNGCCRVLLFSLSGDSIEEGTGPIFTLSYDVAEEAPKGACRDLNPENVIIADENMQPSDIRLLSLPGEFCFTDNEGEDET